MLAIVACQRRELVQPPALIDRLPRTYRPDNATTNSSRVVMLISLMSVPDGKHRTEQVM